MWRGFIYLLSVSAVVLYGCGNRDVRRVSGTPLPVSDSIIDLPLRDTFRLGTLKAGETVVKEFALENAGDMPFVVVDVDSDCGCMITDYDREPLKPGERGRLSVSFDSAGYYGYVLKKVSVFTTLKSEPLVFCMEAEVE